MIQKLSDRVIRVWPNQSYRTEIPLSHLREAIATDHKMHSQALFWTSLSMDKLSMNPTQHLRRTMALIQARLQVLDTQSAGSSEQLDDDVSDCLDEFSEKLEELLQLSSAFSQGWQQEQELIQGKSKTLQMFSQEAQDSWLLVLSSINLLEYHAESLSNASKNRHFQLIRAGSRNLNRLLEDLLILSECQNVKSYGDCSMANAPVGLRVKKA